MLDSPYYIEVRRTNFSPEYEIRHSGIGAICIVRQMHDARRIVDYLNEAERAKDPKPEPPYTHAKDWPT